MILLAGYFDVMFRALIFIGLALSVGGVIFYYFVLRPSEGERTLRHAERRCASLVAFGAFLVAISQFLTLVVTAAALADPSGQWPVADLLGTGFARAGMVHTGFAFCLGFAALRLRGRTESRLAWALTSVFAVAVVVSGAWLTHGASRLENAPMLMAVSVIHQLAAAAWIGGLVHLTAQWRLLRAHPSAQDMWPRLLARFSPMALGSVAVVVTGGIYLYWQYIYSLRGLIGTAYGTMLITKVALMGAALCLGGVNYLTIRAWKLNGDRRELVRRLPTFAEVEAAIGVVILMAAAALTGQPPSIDIPSQQATPAEVAGVFQPKTPQLRPPPHAKMLATASSSLDPYAQPTELSKVQSDFNHNVAGILVILIGLGALIHRWTRARWTRHWPLLFMLLALFLLIIGEPNGWPLGPEGFWRTLAAPDVFTHRLATLMVIVLGMVEWRVQLGTLASTRWRYVFPILCGVGGALLLTHTHSVLAIKRAFLIEASHNAIGILAVLLGASGWLEMRLPGREGRIAGYIWPVCLTLVGVVLLFYRET